MWAVAANVPSQRSAIRKQVLQIYFKKLLGLDPLLNQKQQGLGACAWFGFFPKTTTGQDEHGASAAATVAPKCWNKEASNRAAWQANKTCTASTHSHSTLPTGPHRCCLPLGPPASRPHPPRPTIPGQLQRGLSTLRR
jgi:hypothetical protein